VRLKETRPGLPSTAQARINSIMKRVTDADTLVVLVSPGKSGVTLGTGRTLAFADASDRLIFPILIGGAEPLTSQTDWRRTRPSSWCRQTQISRPRPEQSLNAS
jgi:hypothetical protein